MMKNYKKGNETQIRFKASNLFIAPIDKKVNILL